MRATDLAGALATWRFSPRARTALLFEETLGQRAQPEQARAGMGAQHRADLAGDHRGPAEDLAAALLEPRALVRRVDVLHRPGVGAGLVTLARVVHHSLEHAPARAHALDRDHLALH